MFIKIVFDVGTQEFYDFLNTKIKIWGREFLILAFRVIYYLEKKNLEKPVYQGFKMFSIFDQIYQNDLE